MPPLHEKVKVLSRERKKFYTEFPKIYSKNESSIHEIVQDKRNLCQLCC